MAVRTSVTFIYALCDPETLGCRYIGKSDDPYKRYCEHLVDNCNTYKTHWVQSLLKKGLLPIRQILEECDKSIWQERERDWISYYKNTIHADLTNATGGGYATDGWKKEGSEIKRRRALKGRKCTEETRRRMSEVRKGKKLSEEHIKNMSKAKKGLHLSEGARKNMSRARVGIKFTEQHKQNLSRAMKGKRWPKERIDHFIKTRTGMHHKKRKYQ